jgi:hypothetical protein
LVTIEVLKEKLNVVQEGFTGAAKDGQQVDHLPSNVDDLLTAFETHRSQGYYSEAGRQQSGAEESKQAPSNQKLEEQKGPSGASSFTVKELHEKLTSLVVQMETTSDAAQLEKQYKMHSILDKMLDRQLQQARPKAGAGAAGHG